MAWMRAAVEPVPAAVRRYAVAATSTPMEPVERAEARNRNGSCGTFQAGMYFMDFSRMPV